MSNPRQHRKEPFNIEKWGTLNLLWLNSDKIEASMAHQATNRLDGIGISPHKGYKARELSFLKGYPKLRAIVVANAKTIDISALQYLRQLRFVSLAACRTWGIFRKKSCFSTIKTPSPKIKTRHIELQSAEFNTRT